MIIRKWRKKLKIKRYARHEKLSVAIAGQMLMLTTSGFGLIAALAWNNVIQEFVNTYIKKFFPSGSSFVSLLLYAIIVTILAVFVTFQLSKAKEKLVSI